MPLITSISGLRGTIGGLPGENLTPVDVVEFTSAFASLLAKETNDHKLKIVVGRDARLSGIAIKNQVISTLQLAGCDVIDLDLATTPTVEMSVIEHRADGGIILTASHNPKQWNALKLINGNGEFISEEEGLELLSIARERKFAFAPVDNLGKVEYDHKALDKHIRRILRLPLVNKKKIRSQNLSVAIDGVNSVGGVAVPALLKKLGVETIYELNCEPTGEFAHNPEPLEEHLEGIRSLVKEKKADLGIVVDPDVDRLAFIDESGNMFGEEYTLVAVADYILDSKIRKPYTKASVSNLSSSRALKDVSFVHSASYSSAKVGELNVVKKMKETLAVIGGEGNGGVIYPELHYGRDALVGIALFLSYLAKLEFSVSQLRKKYPDYVMIKHRLDLNDSSQVKVIIQKLQVVYKEQDLDFQDGLRINFKNAWAHLRSSNTEPIMRLYIEAPDKAAADKLLNEILLNIKQ